MSDKLQYRILIVTALVAVIRYFFYFQFTLDYPEGLSYTIFFLVLIVFILINKVELIKELMNSKIKNALIMIISILLIAFTTSFSSLIIFDVINSNYSKSSSEYITVCKVNRIIHKQAGTYKLFYTHKSEDFVILISGSSIPNWNENRKVKNYNYSLFLRLKRGLLGTSIIDSWYVKENK